jgi:hypothetical protein
MLKPTPPKTQTPILPQTKRTDKNAKSQAIGLAFYLCF